ncbi:MAG: hypothetical protein WC584_03235 [Candidatus Pacearchaeota archaeon]
MAALIEKIIASTFEREGTVQVSCGQCGKKYYVAGECVKRDGRITTESLFGAFLSPDKNLYCSRECWAKFCED